MRLRRLLLAYAFALVAVPLTAAAQVTTTSIPAAPTIAPPPRGSTTHPPSHTMMDGTTDTYVTTRSLSGEVRAVSLGEGYIVVADPKRGAVRFYVGHKTRYRADKDSPLGGKKNLTLGDFQEGQTVKVTFWHKTFSVTEVRVRRPKN